MAPFHGRGVVRRGRHGLPSVSWTLRLIYSVGILGSGILVYIAIHKASMIPSMYDDFDRLPLFSTRFKGYVPAPSEQYLLNHAVENGLHLTSFPLPRTCDMWTNATNHPLHRSLTTYHNELNSYNMLLSTTSPLMNDIRAYLHANDSIHNERVVCRRVDLLGASGRDRFPSGQLSRGESFGWIEPLIPPFRHPRLCSNQMIRSVLDMGYMVHDFAAHCRKLKPTSKTVFVDIGASLNFHTNASRLPVVELIDLYRKFGFVFDHIYAFEATPTDPLMVYEKVPEQWLPAYHWINVPVNPDLSSRYHPLEWVLKQFSPDDFVVVKLDVDNPSVELPLARQLLQYERYSNVVDVFYFEMHVHLHDLLPWWGTEVQGSVLDTIQLFEALRDKGIAAHSWV